MSLISGLFKSQKTPSYGGIQPYGTLMDAAGGKDYYNQILGRSQGNSQGYGADYVSSANPQIAQMHGNFTDYQLPELQSELTAEGRSGSPASTAVTQAMRNEGLDEGAIKGQLAQQQAQAIHSDTNQGIQDLGAFNQGDYNARATLSNAEQNQYGQETKNIQADRSLNNQKAMNIGQAAFTAVPSVYGATTGLYKNMIQGRQPSGGGAGIAKGAKLGMGV